MTNIRYIQKYIFEIIAILTIGFPFVIYKILVGILILENNPALFALIAGGFFILWGFIDGILNAFALFKIVQKGNIKRPVCFLSLLLRKRQKELGEAFDTMISFTLVAVVVGGGYLPLFDKESLTFWSMATVINVLGAGIARLGTAFINKWNLEKE